MRACSAAQCGGEECCGALLSGGGTPMWRWRRLPALPCLRPNDTAGAGRDATSPTSRAIRFACQTAKTLPVDAARSEILESHICTLAHAHTAGELQRSMIMRGKAHRPQGRPRLLLLLLLPLLLLLLLLLLFLSKMLQRALENVF